MPINPMATLEELWVEVDTAWNTVKVLRCILADKRRQVKKGCKLLESQRVEIERLTQYLEDLKGKPYATKPKPRPTKAMELDDVDWEEVAKVTIVTAPAELIEAGQRATREAAARSRETMEEPDGDS